MATRSTNQSKPSRTRNTPKAPPAKPAPPAPHKTQLKHGFTGRTLVVHPEEAESYEEHVASYLADYQPATHHQNQLVRQLADLDYSLHQISIEQSNTVTHMNVISSLPPDPANPNAISTLLAPYTRLLNTLNLYETRRRRASKSVAQELEALQKLRREKHAKDLAEATKLYKAYKAKGLTLAPVRIWVRLFFSRNRRSRSLRTRIGFVYSGPQNRKSRTNCTTAKPQPIRVTPQPGRNAPCSCNSGLKFKRCCGK